MLPVNCGSHADYQDFVVTHLCKYYPDLMLLLVPHGISLSGFGISIYLLPILLWLINILNSDQLHELLLVCSVLTFFPLTLKLLL